MIINTSGKIADGLYKLGHPAIPIYLLDGQKPVIVDAGFSFLGDVYASEIEAVLGERQPAYCLLTHSHFDHCGAAANLKKRFPGLKILASKRARQTLSRPNAIALIRKLNQAAQSYARAMGLVFNGNHVFQQFEVDAILKDGDQLEVSDDHVIQVIETPGHTWDCLSYFIPSLSALLCSEAAGQADSNGYIISDCLVDYDQYLASIEKLSELDIEILGLGHLFVYTGDDARAYLPQSHRTCEMFRQMVEARLEQSDGDLQAVIDQIRTIEYDNTSGPKQTEEAYMINLEARIKAVAKRIRVN